MTIPITVGVLALQGAFAEHLQYLARASESPHLTKYQFQFLAVRTPPQLAQCDALVIPGGESTAMSLIAERTQMLDPLLQFVATKPVWGTCAGLIFLASQITNARPHQKILGGMAVEVARNAFGRQQDLFEAQCDFSSFAPISNFRTIFIRAPVVTAVEFSESAKPGAVLANCTNNAKVEVLHRLENGLVVAVRQGNKLGTSFHPELSHDYRFHAWFLEEFVIGIKSEKPV